MLVVLIFKVNMDQYHYHPIYVLHLLLVFLLFEVINNHNHLLMKMEIYFYTMEKYMKEIYKFEYRLISKQKLILFVFFYSKLKPDDNDGVVLSQHLKQCSNETDICNLISTLEGCFAFIYFQV